MQSPFKWLGGGKVTEFVVGGEELHVIGSQLYTSYPTQQVRGHIFDLEIHPEKKNVWMTELFIALILVVGWMEVPPIVVVFYPNVECSIMILYIQDGFLHDSE